MAIYIVSLTCKAALGISYIRWVGAMQPENEVITFDVVRDDAADENKYDLIHSTFQELSDDDFKPLQKKRTGARTTQYGFGFGLGALLAKELVHIGFKSFNFSLMNFTPVTYEFSPITLGIDFSLFALTATLIVNHWNTVVFQDRYQIGKDKIKTLHTGSGQIRFSAGSKGIWVEGEENNFLLHWGRVAKVFPGLDDDALYEEFLDATSQEKFNTAMSGKKGYWAYFAEVQEQFKTRLLQDKSDTPIRVRLYPRGEVEKTNLYFEELVIPKRFFRLNSGSLTWVDFYMHCVGMKTAHQRGALI